jgi:hypothetical protein
MHATIQLVAYWAVAFLTLGLAIVLLNIYFGIISNDLELLSMGAEAAIAGVASLVEAASVWAVISYVPAATRALIVPVIIVALIYKITHLEDWERFDIFMLLFFQAVIGCFGVSLMCGHFQAAITILVGFAGVLFIIASFSKSLL